MAAIFSGMVEVFCYKHCYQITMQMADTTFAKSTSIFILKLNSITFQNVQEY